MQRVTMFINNGPVERPDLLCYVSCRDASHSGALVLKTKTVCLNASI